jgi:hypothetical protein
MTDPEWIVPCLPGSPVSSDAHSDDQRPVAGTAGCLLLTAVLLTGALLFWSV